MKLYCDSISAVCRSTLVFLVDHDVPVEANAGFYGLRQAVRAAA